MDIDIILIHIGTIFPSYLNDCILQLKRFNFKIHLIISKNLVNHILSNEIIISFVEDFVDVKYANFELKGYSKDFRDNFWNSSSKRFFILENYTKENNIQNFFHIENDNLVFDNLNGVKKILTKEVEDMFIVVDSEQRCIPSIIFIKNYKILSKLTEYMMLNLNKNDMENLFSFFKLHRDKVSNLPILPNNHKLDLVSKSGIISSGNINYTNLFDKLCLIFDGAALGQYIGGIDPRNNNYEVSIGFINETTIFDVSKLNIIWESKIPFYVTESKKIPICNLHIHSKNLTKFL